MATLYDNSYDVGESSGVTSLPDTFTPAVTPAGGATHATISNIRLMFHPPTFPGTYRMRVRILDPDDVYSSYVTVEVEYTGDHEIVDFVFSDVLAKITGDVIQFQASKTPGDPGFTTYVDTDVVGDYIIITGEWVSPLPGKATDPDPSNSAAKVTLDHSELTWTEGTGTVTHEQVYFGLSGNMSLVDDNNTDQSFSLADYLPLPYNTAYQWRIDSVNDAGTTTGDTWSFTTLVFAPPVPGGGGGSGSWKLFKRLCACANNKFWYEDI